MSDNRARRLLPAPTLISIGIVIGAVAAGGVWWLMRTSPVESAEHTAHGMRDDAVGEVSAEDDILFWTCGMHPSIRQDGPGKCPICSMDLVPIRASEQQGPGAEDVLARLELTEQARALSRIETVPVTFRRLEHEINTTGRLTLDERRVTNVHTRVGGWIDEVFVEFTGVDVAPGDPLVSIYSEELVTTQKEYLLALRNLERLRVSNVERARAGAESLLEAARQRLLRWEITEAQIAELENTGQTSDHLTLFYTPPPDTPQGGVVTERRAVEGMRVNRGDRLYTVADLSTLWMMADIYEYEMAWVELGQGVEITTPAYPGRVFEGEIAFIEPILDAASRAVQVRVDVQNPDMELRPEMWVDARIRVPLDRSSDVLQRMRDDAQRRWAERMDRGEPMETATTQPTTQPTTAPTTQPTAAYLCPMLCEGGQSEEPGQHCPVCGMVMLPRAEVLGAEIATQPTTQPSTAPYVCPMLCEGGEAHEPGQHCPGCNMVMLPREEVPGAVAQTQPTTQPAPVWEDAPEGTVLSIPDLAVLRTGQREVIYTEDEPGVYSGREVITGPTGHVVIDGQRELYVPVLAGLEPGMRVVTRGNFLLDSQTTLTGAAAAAYGSALETGETPAGHQH
jgi:multidrug efflux pump subunit AcrA (membrane-fusion protein)